jgi:hypothetical protein
VSSSLFALIIVAMVAAIVVRRKMADPESTFGQWCAKTLKPRMAQAARWVAYLTLAAWILIFAFAPESDRGSVGDVLQSFRKAIGLEATKDPDARPIPPPFRIPGPEETAKPAQGRQ